MAFDKKRVDALACTLMAYMQTINFYGYLSGRASDTSSRLEAAIDASRTLGLKIDTVLDVYDKKYDSLIIDGFVYELSGVG